jgi:hypothetical protein
MKCQRFLALVPLLLLCGRASATPGPAPVVITVDENGNGSLTFPQLDPPLLSHIGPDPGPGGLDSVLIYTLPFAGYQGDVHLTDDGVLGDVIRFNGDGTLIFYSDNTDGVDALADTPTPPQGAYTNLVTIPEVGPDGDNGAWYTPEEGQPGGIGEVVTVGQGVGVTYHFISDTPAVPEPGSLALLMTGMFSGTPLALRRLRRR